MPAVWNVPSSGIRPREVSIYRFLKDAQFVAEQTQQLQAIIDAAGVHERGARARVGGE